MKKPDNPNPTLCFLQSWCLNALFSLTWPPDPCSNVARASTPKDLQVTGGYPKVSDESGRHLSKGMSPRRVRRWKMPNGRHRSPHPSFPYRRATAPELSADTEPALLCSSCLVLALAGLRPGRSRCAQLHSVKLQQYKQGKKSQCRKVNKTQVK